MFRLTANYLRLGTLSAARRLVNYLDKHPMAESRHVKQFLRDGGDRADFLQLGLIEEARLRVAEGR